MNLFSLIKCLSNTNENTSTRNLKILSTEQGLNRLAFAEKPCYASGVFGCHIKYLDIYMKY